MKHPNYQKPELLATAPNEVWSWDITKLKGPEKWTYYYLYVILDIYSRCVVGWMLADRESADLAKQLIETTIEKQGISPEQLIIHSDLGLLTPTSLHFGQAKEIITARDETLQNAWQKTPERFVNGVPKAMSIPKAVWINAPKKVARKKNEAPEANCPGAPEETSLTHPRSSYPLEGCVSAEPSSVSPDGATIPSKQSLNTRVMPEKISGVRGLAPEYSASNN